MGRILRTLLVLLLVVAAAALATQNNDELSLRFVVWESWPLPVWVFLLAALAVGIVVGGASLLVDYLRLRHAVGRERRRADEAVQRAEAAERRAEEAARAAESGRSGPGGLPAEVDEIRDEIDLVEDASSESTAIRRGRPPAEFD